MYEEDRYNINGTSANEVKLYYSIVLKCFSKPLTKKTTNIFKSK